MSLPDVVSREEWLAARKALLAEEKAATRARDRLNTARRNLPMVKITKDYVFDGPDGPVRLRDMFGDYRQLALQHVMFDPTWDAACPGCTAGVDEINDALIDHLHNRDTAFVLISRAPLDKLQAYAKDRGWNVPWYSSHNNEFNYDFHVTIDASKAPVLVNYRNPEELVPTDMAWILDAADQPSEISGFSCFLRDGDDVFHTYSTFGRGTEALGGAYGVLDLTALGRQEEWEEPKGRATKPKGADPTFTS